MLQGIRGKGTLQFLPYPSGLGEERVPVEPLPGPSVGWRGGFTPCLNHQGKVEAATHEGDDASLLTQKLYGCLDLVESLQTYTRVRLAAIPSAEEALQDLGMFDFFALNLFSTGGQNL